MAAVGHLGALLVSAGFCGSSCQPAGISNSSDGMLEVSIEVLSVLSDTTRISAPGAGAAAVEPPEEGCAVMELAAALAAGSVVSFAALDAAAPPAESVWMAAAPR